MSTWSIVPASEPTRLPSRYSDWVVTAADSTTWCQFPSSTRPELAIGGAPPVHASPRSLPSVPTYSIGVWLAGVLRRSELCCPNSVPYMPAAVLNHSSIANAWDLLSRLSGSATLLAAGIGLGNGREVGVGVESAVTTPPVRWAAVSGEPVSAPGSPSPTKW